MQEELADMAPRPFYVAGYFYQPNNHQSNKFIPESEKAFLLRESVAELNALKAELLRG